MNQINQVIKERIEKHRAALKERGIKAPVMIEQGPDIEIIKNNSNIVATVTPLLIRIDSTEQKSLYSWPNWDKIRATTKPKVSQKIRSWLAVLLDPNSTNIELLGEIQEKILSWLSDKSFSGLIVFELPVLTDWGTVEIWHRSIAFLDEKKNVYEIIEEDLLDYYPHAIRMGIVKRRTPKKKKR